MLKSNILPVALLASAVVAKPGYDYGQNNYQSSAAPMWQMQTTTTTPMMEWETTSSCESMWTTTAAAWTTAAPPPMAEWSTTSAYVSTATAAVNFPPPPFPPPLPPMGSWGEMLVQTVEVSDNNGSLTYWPEEVVAPVGSIVQFQFNPKNHTVTQSNFANPCVPITVSQPANLTATRPGLDSGFVPITVPIIPPTSSGQTVAVAEDITVYNILINDTLPIWIFCRQTGHCAKGMSMVINVNQTDPTKQLANYKANAAKLLANSTAPPGAPPGVPGYGFPPSWTTTAMAVTTMMTTTSAYAAPSAPPPPPPPPPPAPPVSTTTIPVVPSIVPFQSTTTGVAGPAFTGAASRVDAGRWLGAAVVGAWALL